MDSRDPIETTEQYVDSLFGVGMGKRHVRFLENVANPALRELIHRFHGIEADTRLVTIEENYLLAVCVLCALGKLSTAAMFAKLLRHLGTSSERILEAVGRVAMWAGGLPAVEASFVIQKALREYDRDPKSALVAWFPDDEQP
jgi:hypothetical protein